MGQEVGKSYPSGHATTAIVSLGGWAVVVASSGLPIQAKYELIALFALWAAGIDWSRLALGANYLTDVAGGTLFGSAWLCVLFAVVQTFQVR